MSMLPPISAITPAPPRRASVSTSETETSSNASSQEMRFQRPEPRGPRRRMGCERRAGPTIMSEKEAPFWQPRGLKSGTVSFDAR
jgi:hypothetical protein